uniref:Quick-to-court, isoform E n=2 Tax=Drosophila melanogaster TaxID=7227 RepID=Q59E00_DROME|nr:quick-to-court, isoform E [Drosophila melanogaster]AAX52655.1 quick-to-court, isoform E [Drosophila melanogaster]|eukprot:NP_001014467.1 quick-to-court, isoform E [Drosophila melanogaster]
MMTSLQLETSLPAVEEQVQREKDNDSAEDSHTASTTPTRIPHPAVARFRRSASLRLRGNPAELGLRAEHCPAGGGGFSSRAKLTAIPSSLETRSHPVHLRRNRSWCNLGHKTEQEPEVEASTEALCNAAQCLSLDKEALAPKVGNSSMANGKPRNLSLQLNGGSDISSSGTSSSSSNNKESSPRTTRTPRTPQTPQTPQTPASGVAASVAETPHSCIRQGNCVKANQVKLSTLHESKISPRTPPVTPDSPSTYLDDDIDSMYSFATTTSGRSTMSCEHPYVARNGTTFSGRKMKYVVHCSNYAGQVGPDYLTPTQRAQRQIRRLKELLCIARQDLEQKDTELLRLTREVVELRLFKASLSSPEERSASSDAVTVREAELKTSQDVSPIVDMVDEGNAKGSPRHLSRQQQQQANHSLQAMQMSAEMQSSYADSGHFEDLTMSSVHSKDSQTQSEACGTATPDGEADVGCGAGGDSASNLENYELQRQELISMYEHRIEELIRSQDSATSDLKRSHNDKVEALLQKLAECNTRYSDMVPDYEQAKQRIRELEKQLEDLQRKLIEHEEKQNKMYLHMYQQGQEAERISRADQALDLAQRQPESKVSINELLHQLQSTQDELENIRTIYRRLLEAQKNRTHVDPEVTLQFLKSAIFYFLTDKENSQGHLQAIESILEFTDAEKQKISAANRTPK